MPFWQSPPPPVVVPSFHFVPPSPYLYTCGLAFNIISQLVAVPLCVLTFKLQAYKPLVALFAFAVATIPLYLQPALAAYLIDAGYADALDVLAGRFVSASTYAFCAFRIFGVAIDSSPKGAMADLPTWIAFATGACDILFDKATGKPISPSPGFLLRRIGALMLRLLGISVLASIAQPFAYFPAKAYATANGAGDVGLVLAFIVDHVCVQLFMLYLFISTLLGIGCFLLELQNFTPLNAFENPMFDTRSVRDFWGKKWNVQVTTTLKRCVFVPVRHKLGLPASVAAIATFVTSGLFHEYQFVLSLPHYTFGSISFFFVLHAFFSVGDAIYSKLVGKGLTSLGLPAWMQSIVVLITFSPTIPYFVSHWLEDGVYDVMARMVPRVVYA